MTELWGCAREIVAPWPGDDNDMCIWSASSWWGWSMCRTDSIASAKYGKWKSEEQYFKYQEFEFEFYTAEVSRVHMKYSLLSWRQAPNSTPKKPLSFKISIYKKRTANSAHLHTSTNLNSVISSLHHLRNSPAILLLKLHSLHRPIPNRRSQQ